MDREGEIWVLQSSMNRVRSDLKSMGGVEDASLTLLVGRNVGEIGL